ncbi:MAG: hypothetical protein H6865_03115 [Rhodospirillales bacterium]|nr:hypothetical protein [Alphaproteobacteria bacterium]MCB9986608.1 hypothetical protein [Rhodospirillales bacterium]USO06862.1 MAG: hypothetical protein H6866_05270 [Rhodospirillales bacterium]
MSDANLDAPYLYTGTLATRMACHLGERKASVLCNLLGDQPLFYIDYVDAEDVELDTLMGTDLLAEYQPDDVAGVRARINRLESASRHIDGYERESTEAAFDRAASRTAEFTTIEQLVAVLEKSRIAQSMLADLDARKLNIVMNPQIDSAIYDRAQVAIHVNPRLPAETAALAGVRALRQAWLHLRGAAINPLFFAPEEAILLNRIQHADLACTMIRAAWEMNLSGERGPWARILTGSAYDLAAGFAREAITDFRALNNGQAAHAAFERWFFSGRCKNVDRRLIQTMLADHHGLVFENPSVSRMVTGDVIARTGDMPLGKNYLTGLVEMVLADPLFTEVRDRSNANFLWFIKFERSFRAAEAATGAVAEHNLQGMVPNTADAIPGAPTVQQTENHDRLAEIIAFKGPYKPGKPARKGARRAKNGTDDMATVYYLDHFLTLSNR